MPSTRSTPFVPMPILSLTDSIKRQTQLKSQIPSQNEIEQDNISQLKFSVSACLGFVNGAERHLFEVTATRPPTELESRKSVTCYFARHPKDQLTDDDIKTKFYLGNTKVVVLGVPQHPIRTVYPRACLSKMIEIVSGQAEIEDCDISDDEHEVDAVSDAIYGDEIQWDMDTDFPEL